MKKFIFKSIILIIAVWTPWWMFVEFGRKYYAPVDFLSWKHKHLILEKNDEKFNPEDILIGDSLAVAAIDPRLISDKLYNLAMSGMTPVDGWYYLNKYLASGKTPKRIFISFGTTHWQGSDTFKEYSLGFGYLNTSEFLDFLKQSRNIKLFYTPEETFNVFKDWFPFNHFWNWTVTNLQHSLAFLEFGLIKLGLAPMQINHIKSVMLEMFDKNELENKKELSESIIASRGHHLFEYNETVSFVNPITIFSGWKIHILNDIYLRKILDLGKKKNIKIIIDFVPNNENSWIKYRPAFFEEKNLYFEKLKEIYPELQVSALKSLPENLYGDMDHVNSDGTREYSQIFKEKYYSE